MTNRGNVSAPVCTPTGAIYTPPGRGEIERVIVATFCPREHEHILFLVWSTFLISACPIFEERVGHFVFLVLEGRNTYNLVYRLAI